MSSVLSAKLFKKAIIWPIAFACLTASAVELKPFTTDGCSAFPDGTFSQKKLWLTCCIAHDFSYWRGGTASERLTADLALQACVASVGENAVGALMLAGVRVGGSPCIPKPPEYARFQQEIKCI